METKRAVTIGIITVIFIATAAMFAVKIARKNSSVSNPVPVAGNKSTAKTADKTGSADNSSVQSATSADPDIKALESDLNSVSEEDFSDSTLSDQAVGL